MRSSIDFGIDLGTTNSTVAVLDGIDTRVIQNRERSSVTPSVVWCDRRGRVHVGDVAKQRASRDPQDVAMEFKLLMGQGEETLITFASSATQMTPEALSAEVLKSLRNDVRGDLGEEIRASVVTVPAAFENPQTSATLKAAHQAGLGLSPLLLEPVAASLAYGFQSERSNDYWLVYDFGGGTFDAAVMRIRDGLIQVVDHDGDNFLGGKLLDWAIVEQCLIPALVEQYDLPDFHRGNPQWRNPIQKLKLAAESAKVEVCRTRERFDIVLDDPDYPLCEDARGKPVELVFELTPEQVQAVSLPFIERSLGLCRRTLERARLHGTDLDRVLMVGGSTLNPWVREAVQSELGTAIEYSIDPVTVVARGAAIFAGTQELGEEHRAPAVGAVPAEGGPVAYRLEVAHSPVGNVPDPDIGGRLQAPSGQTTAGCTIEFIETHTQWRSGAIPLDAQGVFMTQLYAERQRRCEYAIELLDATGNALPIVPDRVTYTIGVVPEEPPATMTIGVGLANGEMVPYIEKGARLPRRKSLDHYCVAPIRAGNAADELRVPLLEGEHLRAARNHPIGAVILCGTDIERDLPAGSMVEITVSMDTSQKVRAHAYVSALDQDVVLEFDPRIQRERLEVLAHEADNQRARHGKTLERAQATSSERVQVIFERLRRERVMDDVDRLLAAAASDANALSELDRRLRTLAAALDEAEDALEWPALVAEAEKERADTERVVDEYGEAQDRERLQNLEGTLETALAAGNPDTLRRNVRELVQLWWQVMDRQLGFHMWRLEEFGKRVEQMRDRSLAERLIGQGERAVKNGDIDALRIACRQLGMLLPDAGREAVDRDRVGTTMLYGSA